MVFTSTTLAGPPAGSGTVDLVVSTISFSGQSTPVTFEQQNVFVRDGVSNYVYLVTFGGGQSLDFGFFLDSSGKVRGMAILPPTP